MLICGECGREMECSKTGKAVYFGSTARYAGDEFQCPECRFTVIKCNDEHGFMPEGVPATDIWVRGRSHGDAEWSPEEKEKTKRERYPV